MNRMDPSVTAYLYKNILKSAEYLDLSQGVQSNPASPFIDIAIMKRTSRTYRVVGMLTMAAYQAEKMEEHLDEELRLKKMTPRKKVQLDDNAPHTLKWLEQGWVIKEIRFKSDEKTVETMHYRMGYRLFELLELKKMEKQQATHQEILNWYESAATLESKAGQELDGDGRKGLYTLVNHINQGLNLEHQRIEFSYLFPVRWSVEKRLKFLHFVVAFLQVAFSKTNFDWKEIGASYYQEIGGSKEFDMYKEEFISHLEEWAQCPVDSLGLTSLGRITPLFFSGKIAGRFSSYHYGPVHALTDLAIEDEEYTTESTTMWLVENRAILTRIAAERGFLEETSSLLLCVDGHLRSSHRSCIQQLLGNSFVGQVILWTDYDPDGLQISRELYMAISQFDRIRIKWITHERKTIANWLQYEQYMNRLLQHQHVEQEQGMGGVADWKRWINH